MAQQGPPPSLTDEQSRLTDTARHLSKSASELNGRECSVDESSQSPCSSPQRTKSGANPSVAVVIQKTHGFFNTLKNKWSRARSRERLGRKSPNDFLEHQESTDYAADLSSDSSTPANSPRHRATTIGGSPLARNEIKMSAETAVQNANELSGLETGCGAIVLASGDATQGALDLLAIEELKRKKDTQLRQYVFFQLRIHLRNGKNLVAMDKSGTSDPYVKFKIGNRLLHKSKTIHRDLNPNWNEIFTVPIEDPFQPIVIKVFDYDWGLQDDFMGSAKLDLTQLELGKAEEIPIKLEDLARPNRELGEIYLTTTLWPRSQEDKELYYQRFSKLSETSKKLKAQIWSSVVTIVLVKSRGLPTTDDGNKFLDAHIKFRLGNEKYKSKPSYTERWLEQFDMHLFDDDQMLEISLWNRNVCYGKGNIDLSNYPREVTHGAWQNFDDCDGEIFLMMTISGTTALETISDLKSFKENPKEYEKIRQRYCWYKAAKNFRDVGYLTVKVYGALGLTAADLGGKSDPFCVLELVNARLQTQTEYKTLTPQWNKIFTFNVKDMTSVLELTVYDEDRDHKVEFLGRVSIPLLRIRSGVKRWYSLKDKHLYKRAKGTSPQILLEMSVEWNTLRAAIRALETKEQKLIQQEAKFKRQLFLLNVQRLKTIIMHVYNEMRYFQSCFEWTSPVRSSIAFVVWIMACYFGDIEMIPLILIAIIIKNWFVRWITGSTVESSEIEYDDDDDDDDDDDKEKEEKKSIKERLQAIQDVSQTVQNSIGFLASLCERIANTFNFSVPELSWLATILLSIVFFVLHSFSIRTILLVVGLVKFLKPVVRPNNIPNNEILDFLSRVPDNQELNYYREIPTGTSPETPKMNVKKKTKAS